MEMKTYTLPVSKVNGTYEDVIEIMLDDPFGFCSKDWQYMLTNATGYPKFMEDVLYYTIVTDDFCYGFGILVEIDGVQKFVGMHSFCAMDDAYRSITECPSKDRLHNILNGHDCDGLFEIVNNTMIQRVSDDKFYCVWYRDPIVIE